MPNWNDILQEIRSHDASARVQSLNAIAIVRRKYMERLHKMTGRNVIAYYSGWLSKPYIVSMALTDEDKNGFMACVHNMKCGKGLDLILHTPGGNVSATQSLVNYLRKKFGDDIRAIIPQIAMSAGTMLACSCKSIVMGTQSNLGPIDPILNGIPAYTALEEFQQACEEIVNERGTIDEAQLKLWQQIIGRYQPTFLTQCRHAINRSNSFVRDQLEQVMFKGLKTGARKARKVVEALTRHEDGHTMHYHLDECKSIGLKIESLEEDQDFQDIVLSVHHAFMHTLMNTSAIKIVENHMGIGMVKSTLEPKQE